MKSDQQKNVFLLLFIDDCIHKFLNELFIKKAQDSTTTQKKEITTSLKNLGKTQLLVKKQVTNVFRNCSKNIKLNVAFKKSNLLFNVFRFRDQLPKCINSKVLYKYKCDIYNNVYIGKTKRYLIVCQYGHMGKSIATDKLLKCSDRDGTAIRKHCYSLDLALIIYHIRKCNE